MRLLLSAACAAALFVTQTFAACPSTGSHFYIIADTPSPKHGSGVNGSYAYLDGEGPHISFPATESGAALFYLDANKQLHSTAVGPKNYAGTYDISNGYGILFSSASFGLTPITCAFASQPDNSCQLTCLPGFATSDDKLYECPFEKPYVIAYFHSKRETRCSPLKLVVEAA